MEQIKKPTLEDMNVENINPKDYKTPNKREFPNVIFDDDEYNEEEE